MTGHRHGKVADTIHRALAEVIQTELRDPRVGFVTLTEVRLSPDLRHARVFFTLLGSSDREATREALDHAEPFLRREIGRRTRLRFVPRLRFHHDDVPETGRRVDDLLRDLDPLPAGGLDHADTDTEPER